MPVSGVLVPDGPWQSTVLAYAIEPAHTRRAIQMAETPSNDDELKDPQGTEEDVQGHGIDEEDDGEVGVLNVNCGC